MRAVLLGILFVLALPPAAMAIEENSGFGSSLFSGSGHPAFADPVAANIADAADFNAAAFAAIEPAAGDEVTGHKDSWVRELPESLIEIKTAPVPPEETGDKPPVF